MKIIKSKQDKKGFMSSRTRSSQTTNWFGSGMGLEISGMPKFFKEDAYFTTQDGYNVAIDDKIWIYSQSGKVSQHIITSFLVNLRGEGKFDNVITTSGSFNGSRVYATKRQAMLHGTICIADGTRVRQGSQIWVKTSGKLIPKLVVSTQTGLRAKKEHSDYVRKENPNNCYSLPKNAAGEISQLDAFDKVVASFNRAVGALISFNEIYDEEYTPESFIEMMAS